MFFKIESWNLQHLFKIEFRETSQNFNSNRQPIEKIKNNNCLNELKWWGFTKFYFKQMLKVSAFYHEKQKSFIPKKNIFLAVVSKHAKIIPKDVASCPIFQWRFWLNQSIGHLGWATWIVHSMSAYQPGRNELY